MISFYYLRLTLDFFEEVTSFHDAFFLPLFARWFFFLAQEQRSPFASSILNRSRAVGAGRLAFKKIEMQENTEEKHDS